MTEARGLLLDNLILQEGTKLCYQMLQPIGWRYGWTVDKSNSDGPSQLDSHHFFGLARELSSMKDFHTGNASLLSCEAACKTTELMRNMHFAIIIVRQFSSPILVTSNCSVVDEPSIDGI